MSYSLGHYSFGGGGSSLQGGGYSYAADDAYASQQPYDDEADRSDVLKLVLYDLNSAIAPRDVRLMAIHAGEWGRNGTLGRPLWMLSSAWALVERPTTFSSRCFSTALSYLAS